MYTEYAYITTTRSDSEPLQTEKTETYIGVDLNTTGHVAVVSNPETGKIWKLGKKANHIALKYREIRKQLSKQGKYRKVKQIKDRQKRVTRNLNHHISKKVIEIARTAGKGIRIEKLTKIRQRANKKNSKIISLFFEQLVILSTAKDDRVQSQVARYSHLLYRPTIHVKDMQQVWAYRRQRRQEFQVSFMWTR